MRGCVEEGLLQAYVDNELSSEMVEEIAVHIAACATCAEAATQASAETALFATALEAENSRPVPSVKLRERIDAAISEIERPSDVSWRKENSVLSGWLASFAGLFKGSPQRALGFASLIALVAFAAIFALVRSNRSTGSDGKPTEIAEKSKGVKTAPDASPSPSTTPVQTEKRNDNKQEKIDPNERTKPKKQNKPSLVPAPSELPKDELAGLKPLPGEENYLKAIDSLRVEIETSGETAMKPSLRAEYERTLAIVDQAIDSNRRTARRNPRDSDASAFLYSSYQSKLDLLTAVADQVRPTIATR